MHIPDHIWSDPIQGIGGRFTPETPIPDFLKERRMLVERIRSAREDRQGGRVSESEKRQRDKEQTRMMQNMRNRSEDRKGDPNLANIPNGFGNRLKEYMTPSEFEVYMANQRRNYIDPRDELHIERRYMPPEIQWQAIADVLAKVGDPFGEPISHYMVENPDFGWDDVRRINPFGFTPKGTGSPEWPFQVVPTSEYDVNVGGTAIWPPHHWNQFVPDMWQYLRFGGFPLG